MFSTPITIFSIDRSLSQHHMNRVIFFPILSAMAVPCSPLHSYSAALARTHASTVRRAHLHFSHASAHLPLHCPSSSPSSSAFFLLVSQLHRLLHCRRCCRPQSLHPKSPPSSCFTVFLHALLLHFPWPGMRERPLFINTTASILSHHLPFPAPSAVPSVPISATTSTSPPSSASSLLHSPATPHAQPPPPSHALPPAPLFHTLTHLHLLQLRRRSSPSSAIANNRPHNSPLPSIHHLLHTCCPFQRLLPPPIPIFITAHSTSNSSPLFPSALLRPIPPSLPSTATVPSPWPPPSPFSGIALSIFQSSGDTNTNLAASPALPTTHASAHSPPLCQLLLYTRKLFWDEDKRGV